MSTQVDTDATDWTLGRLLQWTTDYLGGHDVEEPRLAAEVLLAHVAECPRIQLYARFDEVLNGAALDCFRDWVKRAAKREPIAYLVGEKEFYSLPFSVTGDVLIPRPETEILVERVVDHLRGMNHTKARLLEIGTGSGCIVIAVLKQLGEATAVATDVSSAALTVARGNAERHGVLDRLALVEADRFALPADAVMPQSVDAIMCNPPYVAAADMKGLDSTVRDYEPSTALTDGGDGLSFYRSIVSDGVGLLAAGGAVFVEIGDGQAESVIEVMSSSKSLVHRGTWKDRVTGKERTLMFARSTSG